VENRGNFSETLRPFFILACCLFALIDFDWERLGIGKETSLHIEALILFIAVIYVYRQFTEKVGTNTAVSKNYQDDLWLCDNDNDTERRDSASGAET
jgi:hypothetical protein